MRNELELMELADRYLLGELAPTDRSEFEARMRENADLRELVADQSDLHAGMQRISTRSLVESAYRTYRWTKWKPWFMASVLVAITAAVAFLSYPNGSHEQAPAGPPTELPAEEVLPADGPDPEKEVMELNEVRADTVRMILRAGKLVPYSEQDSTVRITQKVITVPVEGTREEVMHRIDSLQKALPDAGGAPLYKVIGPDSLRYLLEARPAPMME